MKEENQNDWVVWLSLFLSIFFIIGIIILQLQTQKLRQQKQTITEYENLQQEKLDSQFNLNQKPSQPITSADSIESTKGVSKVNASSAQTPMTHNKKNDKRIEHSTRGKVSTTSTYKEKTTTEVKLKETTTISEKITTTTTTPATIKAPNIVLVVNLKTKKIHSASCPLLKKQNQDYITEILAKDLSIYLSEGYTLCSRCKGDIHAEQA